MRIALLDLYTGGHHLIYGSALVKYLRQRGHEVMFITWERDERVDEALISRYPDLTLTYLHQNGDMGLDAGLLLRQYRTTRLLYRGYQAAERWRADVLHLLYATTFPPPYLLSYERWPFKLFGTFFGVPFQIVSDWDRGIKRTEGMLLKLHQLFFKLAINRAFNGLFIQSVYPQIVRDAFFRHFTWTQGCQDKVFFLPDPIYEDYYSSVSQAEARERLDLPPSTPILLFFGQFTRGKGLDILLEAVQKIENGFSLLIAGAPTHFSEENIEYYRRQLHDPRRIISRLDFIPEEEVPLYYMSADAIVMPYRRSYATGTSGILMQACSARKPVICSDVGTIGQLVKSSALGIVVTPESPTSLAEGILTFLEGMDDIKDEVLFSATKYMEKARWETIAAEIETAYTKG